MKYPVIDWIKLAQAIGAVIVVGYILVCINGSS